MLVLSCKQQLLIVTWRCTRLRCWNAGSTAVAAQPLPFLAADRCCSFFVVLYFASSLNEIPIDGSVATLHCTPVQVISETYHRRCKFVDPLVSTSGHREVKVRRAFVVGKTRLPFCSICIGRVKVHSRSHLSFRTGRSLIYM